MSIKYLLYKHFPQKWSRATRWNLHEFTEKKLYQSSLILCILFWFLKKIYKIFVKRIRKYGKEILSVVNKLVCVCVCYGRVSRLAEGCDIWGMQWKEHWTGETEALNIQMYKEGDGPVGQPRHLDSDVQ